MASDLNIPQFGTGATPGLNAPRMQAIWTFLKSIALGGSGSVIKADNATQLAATTPSAVGLSMLSAADKAAQQALVAGSGFDSDTVDGYHAGAVGVANSLVVRNASGQLQDMADYGIGTVGAVKNEDLDTIISSGIYAVTYGVGYHWPTGTTNAVLSVFVGASDTEVIQTFYARNTEYRVFIRKRLTGTWSAWFEMWNSGSDGNGGQPPAPKPRTSSGNIGHIQYRNPGSGVAWNLPAGGRWAYWGYRFSDSALTFSSVAGGEGAGGDLVGTSLAGSTWRCFEWRVS